MFDYSDFDETFDFDPNFSYEHSAVERITSRRNSLDGLFVDKVMKLLGIKRREHHNISPALYTDYEMPATKVYPPKSNLDLRALHQTIVGGNGADHTKRSLLYYVLLDCDASTRKNSFADAFEQRSSLPERYQIFIKGLWHMDQLDFDVGYSLYLCTLFVD